jgi:AcrR family transcriptional regulator
MPRAQLTSEELDLMRLRLSRAALRIYRAEGLDAISFRRLAEAEGISHTLPYRYFENKEALLARVRIEVVNALDAFLLEREPPRRGTLAGVRRVVDGFVEFARQYPQDYLLIFTTHQPPPTDYPELLAARQRVFERAVQAVQACVDSGEAVGDAREIAHSVWICLHGLMTLHVANQLVHGYGLDQLVDPVMDRVLFSAAAGRASKPVLRRGRHAAARTPRSVAAK